MQPVTVGGGLGLSNKLTYNMWCMKASNCLRGENIKPAALKLIMIKGFIMSDNNYLDHEWGMLICAGAGAHKIARELHSFRHACKYLEPPICWWNVKQHKGLSSSWHINYSEQLSFVALSLLLTALSEFSSSTTTSYKSIISFHNGLWMINKKSYYKVSVLQMQLVTIDNHQTSWNLRLYRHLDDSVGGWYRFCQNAHWNSFFIHFIICYLFEDVSECDRSRKYMWTYGCLISSYFV